MKIKKVIIGLEVHVELQTRSKMFCSCSADHFGKTPNTQTCPVCLGLPGALPVPNIKAIEDTILLGIALGCKIEKNSHFDRKNYFYPDLPKGYQISQYEEPFSTNGELTLNSEKIIKIKRVHLEEDTGKLLHEKIEGEKVTLVDFNRSGVPLVEIVSEPDISSSDEAKEYLEKIQQLTRYLGVSNADMEKGSMRCEPTVNLQLVEGDKNYYTPLVELKNINSFRFAKKAIDFEIERQLVEFMKKREEKKPGNKSTRGWDETKNVTFLQRVKEESNDYRYFPEPDIPPFEWSEEDLDKFGKLLALIELPDQKKKRIVADFGLTDYQANILTQQKETADFYEETVELGKKHGVSPLEIANIIINKKSPKGLSALELVEFIIGSKKTLQVSEKELDEMIRGILKKHPEVIEGYKKGKEQALGLVVGLIKKKTGLVVSLERIKSLT